MEEFDASLIHPERSKAEDMMAQPWTMRPFKSNRALEMPVFDFISGKFSGEVAQLDPLIFNLPLRRDIVA
jgi:hypothetical protein